MFSIQATSKRKRGVLEAYSVDANSDVVIVEFIEGCHKIKKRKQTADRRPVNPEDRIALGEKVEPYGYDTADFDQFISKDTYWGRGGEQGPHASLKVFNPLGCKHPTRDV